MSKAAQTCWDIRPHDGCGVLSFGMEPTLVAHHLGSCNLVNPHHHDGISEVRPTSPWKECVYEDDKLTLLVANLSSIQSLSIAGHDMLDQPILSVIQILEILNSEIKQAQGGSLYFDHIGVAILQFEDAACRELFLFSDRYDHREPLRKLSFSEVVDYYTGEDERDNQEDCLRR